MSKTRLKEDKAITRFDDEKDRLYFIEVMVRARDSITDPPHPKMTIKDEKGDEITLKK